MTASKYFIFVVLWLLYYTYPTQSQSDAYIKLNVDHNATISVASDGHTFTPTWWTIHWTEQYEFIIPSWIISPSTIVKFECIGSPVAAGFLANIYYNGIDHYTTNPIEDSLYKFISSSDNSSTLAYTRNGEGIWGPGGLPGITREAYWIWTDQINNNLVFHFHFPGSVVNDSFNCDRTLFTGNRIGYMDIFDEVSMEFSIMIHSFDQTAEWRNIIHIGDANTAFYPSISINTNRKYLRFSFSEPGNGDQSWRSDNYSLTTDQTYNIQFVQGQDTRTISLDGVVIDHNATAPSHAIQLNQPIHLCTSTIQEPCADATVSNLVIDSMNSVAPTKFNYLCDSSRRLSPIGGTWTLNDATCTVTQTHGTYQGAVAWMGDLDPLSIHWSDYTVTTSFQIISGTEAGLLIRAQSVSPDNDAGKQFYIGVRDSDHIQFGRMNDSWNLLHIMSTTMAISEGVVYTMRVSISGNTTQNIVTAYLDDERQFIHYVNDSSLLLSRGSVGLRTWGAHVEYRSLEISFPSANHFISSCPTASPTIDPTTPPSQAPTPVTDAPTRQTITPSKAPTGDPTHAPSKQTNSPSTATTAPTICIDYDHYANDGRNEFTFDRNNVNITNYIDHDTIHNTTDHFTPSLSDGIVDKDITCDAMHCLVECNDVASCLLTNITATPVNNETMAIFCAELYSCLSATVSSHSHVSHISVHCIAENSCSGMVIDVSHFNSFNVYCTHAAACDDMKINIVTNNDHTNHTNDGIIHCVSPKSCSRLHITTTSNRTQLIMLEHSDEVVLDNGVGYLSATNNIDCNTNRYIEFKATNETVESVSIAILNEYDDTELPCSDVRVVCGNAFCDMRYAVNQIKIQSLQQEMSYNGCYWLNVEAIQDVFCEGQCEQSPTESPTPSPTSQPTNPTSKPSFSPTSAPSAAPSYSPSYNPSLAPSSAPSASPTLAPSFLPTSTPSVTPSSAPSFAPSIPPTSTPSQSPSTAPSSNPSLSPTNIPSYPPSHHPTIAPSLTPSNAPSGSPTNTPSYSPSSAPTRVPTRDRDDIYKFYIPITYEVRNLYTNNIDFIVNRTEKAVNSMQEIIERSYFTKETLEYSQFYVYIQSINSKSIVDDKSITAVDLAVLYLNEPMILHANIECGERIKESIIIKTETPSFKESAQTQLRQYFKNNDLLFDILDSDTLSAIPKFESQDPPNMSVIYISISIVSFGLFCSFAAFVVNKIGKVDNSAFMVPLFLSLGIYDFISDINFAIQVWYKAAFALKDLITWLATASTFFTVLPLATNLIYAMRISKQKTIKANPAARAWFKSHLNVFILICFATGGAYPGLSLVSSRIFGLDFFDSGLLTSELHELSKIKIKSTVLMENAPQLLIQIIYSMIIDRIDSDTLLAFVASTLSVFASLIVYQAQKDQLSEGHIVKYFVRFYNDRGITQEKQEQIKQRKGLKEQISFALSSVFEVPRKTIEIGYVTLVGTGCVMNIQHFVFNDDMEVLREKLLKQVLESGGLIGMQVQVTPQLFITNFYESYQRQLADALSMHFFTEKNDLFSVAYHNKFEEASNNVQAGQAVALATSSLLNHDTEGVLEIMATNLRQKTMNKLPSIQMTAFNSNHRKRESTGLNDALLDNDDHRMGKDEGMLKSILKVILDNQGAIHDIQQKMHHFTKKEDDMDTDSDENHGVDADEICELVLKEELDDDHV